MSYRREYICKHCHKQIWFKNGLPINYNSSPRRCVADEKSKSAEVADLKAELWHANETIRSLEIQVTTLMRRLGIKQTGKDQGPDAKGVV